MLLDSEAQRQLLLDLLGNIPVEANMAALRKGGLRDDLEALFRAIETAPVAQEKRSATDDV